MYCTVEKVRNAPSCPLRFMRPPQHLLTKAFTAQAISSAWRGEGRGCTEGYVVLWLFLLQVKTKVPFLLKFPLREYQHIGLDWLVTIYRRRLNGILADEVGGHLNPLCARA